MSVRTKAPFEYRNKKEFHQNLVDWVGDVLYDILPEHGYEVRDEQIYTAFQIADAICENKVHLAEAGLGTGKTFAYLLSAIPYARFTGKPVVIACATTALQEQLAAEHGDIMTLSKLLNLKVDARMAKDPREYICDVRVSESVAEEFMDEELEPWLKQTKRGERSEIPTIPDRIWKKISWNEALACDVCDYRGFCKLVKAREHYRGTSDLLIVDHETFFHDLWTRGERIANGQLPLLPNYSAVIFDEGHKIMLPAAMQAGQQVNQDEMEQIISTIEEVQGARDSFINTAVAVEQSMEQFFQILRQSLVTGGSSDRQAIRMSMPLLKAADTFRARLDRLFLELQIEQGLYFESIPQSLMQAYEGQIERAVQALTRFVKQHGKDAIAWVSQKDGSFWVVPRNLNHMLNHHLFKKELPVIFTSATLSNEGDFQYFERSLGIEGASTSTIGSPFDIEKQVVVQLHHKHQKEVKIEQKIETLITLLEKNKGRALVLVNSMNEIRLIRKMLKDYSFPFEVLYEDEGDRGHLVRRFKEEETTVLIGANLWEGIDVPGEALTLVVVFQLPFPKLDPLIEVQRKEAKAQGLDPVTTVDYPEMGLKLKQGCGRLIRTEDDHGIVAILDPTIGTPWESIVMGAIPTNAKVVG